MFLKQIKKSIIFSIKREDHESECLYDSTFRLLRIFLVAVLRLNVMFVQSALQFLFV